MKPDEIRNHVISTFESCMAASATGMKLRGSLDAQQHELLASVLRDAANNLAMGFQSIDGKCIICDDDQ